MDKKYQIEKWEYLRQDIQAIIDALSGERNDRNLNTCAYVANSALANTLLDPYLYDIPFIAEEIGLVKVWGIGYLDIYYLDLRKILDYLHSHDYDFLNNDKDGFYTIIDGERMKIHQFYISREEFEKGYKED